MLHSLLAGLSAVSVRFVPLATQSEVGHGMEMDGSSRVQQSPCTDWMIFDFCPVDEILKESRAQMVQCAACRRRSREIEDLEDLEDLHPKHKPASCP